MARKKKVAKKRAARKPVETSPDDDTEVNPAAPDPLVTDETAQPDLTLGDPPEGDWVDPADLPPLPDADELVVLPGDTLTTVAVLPAAAYRHIACNGVAFMTLRTPAPAENIMAMDKYHGSPEGKLLPAPGSHNHVECWHCGTKISQLHHRHVYPMVVEDA
jgi:hypothetical protein